MALSRRHTQVGKLERPSDDGAFAEADLEEIEARFPEGMSVQQVVDAFTARGVRLTEATFRKYVQLGLLPRSVRVGRKGKHRGSQGLYPASAIRQIEHVRRLMGQGFTMEEILREFLFVRGDVEALERQLERVYSALDFAIAPRGTSESADPLATRALGEARAAGVELIGKLEALERRLTMRARMARALV
jgi:DNA-binding transcriptional MerR regulator